MYWQNNQHKSGPPQNRFSPSSSNSCGQHGDMGNPFMSPMHRPRFQSSPRYQAQFGSPFPDPYRFPPGGLCPQRSPRYSPRYDCNYSSPESNMSSMDSPYYRGRKNRCMSRPQSENGRGRGNLRYPKDLVNIFQIMAPVLYYTIYF